MEIPGPVFFEAYGLLTAVAVATDAGASLTLLDIISLQFSGTSLELILPIHARRTVGWI
jgi:hypothetical protein